MDVVLDAVRKNDDFALTLALKNLAPNVDKRKVVVVAMKEAIKYSRGRELDPELCKILVATGDPCSWFEPNEERGSGLMLAILNDSWVAAGAMLTVTPASMLNDPSSYCVLLLACRGGAPVNIIKILVEEKGCCVNGKATNRTTPLIECVIKQSYDSMSSLIKAGADVNQTSDTNGTALHSAAATGFGVGKLLGAGAQLNIKCKALGETPLMAAARQGLCGVIREIAASAGLRPCDRNGACKCLGHGCKDGFYHDKTFARETLSAYSDAHRTAMFWLALKGHACCVTVLLNAGATIDNSIYQRYSALGAAIFRKNVDVVELLLLRMTGFNLPAQLSGEDRLCEMAREDDRQFVEMNHPIYVAISRTHPRLAVLLMKCGFPLTHRILEAAKTSIYIGTTSECQRMRERSRDSSEYARYLGRVSPLYDQCRVAVRRSLGSQHVHTSYKALSDYLPPHVVSDVGHEFVRDFFDGLRSASDPSELY